MRDLHNILEVRRAISPTRATDNTALVSQIIDCANRDALEFFIAIGTLADASAIFTTLVEHGAASDLSDAVAVPDAELIGTESAAGFVFSDDDEVRSIGYMGNQRYVRLTITPAGNEGNADISAIAVLGHARKMPV